METLGLADFLRPEHTSLNRLPMRAPLPFHDTAEDAARADGPRRRLSLDGTWDFQLVDSPVAVPADWPNERPDVAVREVAVPGCWTMQGVGDHPHYTNIIMPWPGLDAPETPEHNPTGLYSTEFTLSEGWLDDDIVLHLGGFESMAAVWCNGVFVGMGKDSRLASEFDLNAFATAGRNELDIIVVRYCGDTWIEDQDHWWHAGLHRSVFVEARPKHRVDDVHCVADFDPTTGKGALHLDAHVCGPGAAGVRVTVWDGEAIIAQGSAPVASAPDGAPLDQLVGAYVYPGRIATVDLEVDGVEAWTAETPRRYRVVVEVIPEGGTSSSAADARGGAVGVDVGFRRVEVRDRRFLVNGTPITFHGVNRHDHHPDTGKVLTEQDLREDLLAMKRHNINALRCAHYPNDPVLLDLCDELGLWVIDEANVESHARLRSVSDDPRYLAAIVDRVARMVVRDRNHPSVVMWSLGNESGHGVAHDAAAAWVRASDPSRPLHYEGAIQQRFRVEGSPVEDACQAPSDRERRVTDVVCPMYTAVEIIEAWAEWAESTGLDDRPLVLCEYSHAMGNSNGGFDRYSEAFHRLDALAGGFIWDWKDQGLRAFDDAGREYWAYGGHFGDEPNDANFCINGLVGPDGLPHPGLVEVAWGYQPVRFSLEGDQLRVSNRRSFLGLDDLDCRWELLVAGHPVDKGSIDLDLGPAESTLIDLPSTTTGGDVVLRFGTRLRDSTAWAPAGSLVATDEVTLSTPTGRLKKVGKTPTPAHKHLGDWRFNLGHDALSLTLDGSVWLRALRPSLWRAPTDNDGVAQGWMSEVAGVRPNWRRLGLAGAHGRYIDRPVNDDGPLLSALWRWDAPIPEALQWEQTLWPLEHGVLLSARFGLDGDVDPRWRDVPRLGLRFEVPATLDRLRWFGLGPHETYPDRARSGRTGIWQSTVAEQYHPFAVPQEHGAHEQTRWFELTDDRGRGLRIEMVTPQSFSARFHHDDALTGATTLAELVTAETIEVHVDAAIRGLGTGACGPDVESGHRVDATQAHSIAFTISEVNP